MKTGKMIALYGVNNLGKTTQARLLVKRIADSRHKVEYLKYPLYDLAPTGPAINAYLREGNPENWSATMFQLAQTMNRLQYDPSLRQILDAGTHVVCEDYRGTGVAWGMGSGVDAERLIRLNGPLVSEDVVILLDGRRFIEAREENHFHEQNDSLADKVREAHLKLASRFNWHIVHANQSVEGVHAEIWRIVEPELTQ